MKKLIVGFAIAALAVCSAETYKVKLFQPTVVQGTELKAGDYKFEVSANKLTIANGKQTVNVDVKVENGAQKFDATSVRYATANGKSSIQEVRLGGTKTKLVFND